MKPPKKKQIMIFGIALILGVIILSGRSYFERSFGRSVAQINFSNSLNTTQDSEIVRDYEETNLVTDELAAEAETLDSGADKKNFSPALSGVTIQKLKELRTQIRNWAPVCEDGSLTYHECPYHDSLHFMGLLCLSGDEHYCELVKKSQDETGRFWKDPSPSSRSLSKGVLAFLVAKNDKNSAKLWIDSIRKNNDRFCPESKESDQFCKTTASFWAMVSKLNDWIQWEPSSEKLKATKFLVERNATPSENTLNPRGYEINATSELIYILHEMEKRGAKLYGKDLIERTAKILENKHPESPLLRYLVRGPDEKTAQMILSNCPSTKPFPKMVDGWPAYDTEFSDKIKDKGHLKVGGHYCIFLINTLLGSTK